MTITIPPFPPSFAKSWKTTVTSILAGGSAFVLFGQQLHYINPPGWMMAVALFTTSGGLVAFGLSAKDANVTGGTSGQPSTSQALADANQQPSQLKPPEPGPAVK